MSNVSSTSSAATPDGSPTRSSIDRLRLAAIPLAVVMMAASGYTASVTTATTRDEPTAIARSADRPDSTDSEPDEALARPTDGASQG